MAGTSLLALIDDIATLLDDVATMTKVAANKTAGVLGDDLALNAQQVTGVRAEREIPVVLAVAKGSLKNKAILVPAALLISLFLPWAITPLLMLGGAFLCFEGAEKLVHRFLHSPEENDAHNKEKQAALLSDVDMVAFEKDKIKGAIRTDFILSAEIITITLGTVAEASLLTQMAVLVVIAVVMTVGVYGFVGGLVKIDDLGLHLFTNSAGSAVKKQVGTFLLNAAPVLMKFLSIAGTLAMFLVGGGILTHGISAIHHLFEHWAELISQGATWYAWTSHVLVAALNGVTGLLAGLVLVVLIQTAAKITGKKPAAH